MNPTLEIFSQGEEIVTGQTVDTNAVWLSQQAVVCGFTVGQDLIDHFTLDLQQIGDLGEDIG